VTHLVPSHQRITRTTFLRLPYSVLTLGAAHASSTIRCPERAAQLRE
jgi:hypothetical protein